MKTQFKKARTRAQIEADPRVSSIHMEWEDGERHWCVYLKRGWAWCEETHQIHELTIRDAAKELDRTFPCRCHLCLRDDYWYGETLPDNLDGLDPRHDYRDLPKGTN